MSDTTVRDLGELLCDGRQHKHRYAAELDEATWNLCYDSESLAQFVVRGLRLRERIDEANALGYREGYRTGRAAGIAEVVDRLGPTQLIPETPGGPPYPVVANQFGVSLDPLPRGVQPLTEIEGTVEPAGQPARPMTQSEKDAL